MVKSLTKFFCIPGLRLGMAWGEAGIMERIKSVRLPWSVNGLSQALAPRLYSDPDYLERSRERTGLLRSQFSEALRSLPGFTPFPADANFLLVELPSEWPRPRLQRELLSAGILIRSCEGFQSLGARYCRLAVRPKREQDQLMEALRELVHGGDRRPVILFCWHECFLFQRLLR